MVAQLAASAGGRLSPGPSSALARQILDGAPADVYVTASRHWMQALEDAGALAGPPRLVAGNSLVCVASSEAALQGRGVEGPRELASCLREGERVAIADAGVPVGEYARESLADSGVLDALRPHLVGQADARDCLRAVLSGQAVAGFVYATDVLEGGGTILFELDPKSHQPAEVWAAVTSEREEAQAFLERLTGPSGRACWRRAGFTDPPSEP